jgi:hypothetical protein
MGNERCKAKKKLEIVFCKLKSVFRSSVPFPTTILPFECIWIIMASSLLALDFMKLKFINHILVSSSHHKSRHQMQEARTGCGKVSL